jgi:hypothetical protein
MTVANFLTAVATLLPNELLSIYDQVYPPPYGNDPEAGGVFYNTYESSPENHADAAFYTQYTSV